MGDGVNLSPLHKVGRVFHIRRLVETRGPTQNDTYYDHLEPAKTFAVGGSTRMHGDRREAV